MELVLHLFDLRGLESGMVASFTLIGEGCQSVLPVGANPEHEAVAATGADVLNLCQAVAGAVEADGQVAISCVGILTMLESGLKRVRLGGGQLKTSALHHP